MQTHIALIADHCGHVAHVYGKAPTFGLFACQLEDIGCQVIEDQSSEWHGCTNDEIEEDCLSIQQLLVDSDFTPHI